MDNYLANHDTLAKIIDALITQKYPDQPFENFKELRKKSIEELDDQISTAIFSKLTQTELAQISQMLDNDATTNQEFQDFFDKANLDFEKIVSETVKSYSENFLKGVQNA